MTKHFGKNLILPTARMVVLACSGRAVSNVWAVTDRAYEVTCKACQKKIAPVVPNMSEGKA